MIRDFGDLSDHEVAILIVAAYKAMKDLSPDFLHKYEPVNALLDNLAPQILDECFDILRSVWGQCRDLTDDEKLFLLY